MQRRALSILLTAATALVIAAAAPAQEKKSVDSEKSPDSSDDIALSAIDAFIKSQSIDTSKAGWKTGLPEPPKVKFDAKKQYFWELETSQGPLTIKLMADIAPMHVSSTIYLTRLKFYDGTIFHRVIKKFMAQGGDPLGSGTGGPGYEYDGELDPSVSHDRPGLLSMANRGRGTDGSQFFLTFVPTPWLDGKHTLFGEVVKGEKTLKELEKRGSSSGSTSETLELKKATIRVE